MIHRQGNLIFVIFVLLRLPPRRVSQKPAKHALSSPRCQKVTFRRNLYGALFVAVTCLETKPILSDKILENSTKFCLS